MKPVAFDYVRPSALADAAGLAAREDAVVKFLAGGQSLGPMLNLRLVQPDVIVDITAIPELKRVMETPRSIVIGSCITHADIEDGRIPDVTNGAMRSVAAGIAYRAVRNRGTIGGSVVHADPSADWISALSGLGGQVVIQGRGGERRVPVEDFIVGVFETVLTPGEVVSGIDVPRQSAGARWGYYKICRKTGEFAHAIGACLHDRDRAVFRAVVGATGGRPFVFTDPERLFGGASFSGKLDDAYVGEMMTARGMTDPIERQIHTAALRRAIAKAYAS